MNHYKTISKAIHYFVDHQVSQPSLHDVAKHVGVSEFHLQRLFSEWVGLSPKQFLQFLTKENAKQHLKSHSVIDASLESGLSGSGRLHDLLLQCEGVTPGEFKRMGEGINITFGVGDSPFGRCFIAQTERGICKLAFFDEPDQISIYENELKLDWPNAHFSRDDKAIALVAGVIFSQRGKNLVNQGSRKEKQTLRILMKGSPFQIKVWEALLTIPEGELSSYQMIADQIDSPSAARAVASAIAKNNIGYLIPCHRVIRGTGVLNQYRWGPERKMAMIGWELSRHQV